MQLGVVTVTPSVVAPAGSPGSAGWRLLKDPEGVFRGEVSFASIPIRGVDSCWSDSCGPCVQCGTGCVLGGGLPSAIKHML